MGVTNLMGNFVREYSRAGYSAKFLGTDAHTAFFGLIKDMGLWDEIDGSLFLMISEWWNEDSELISLVDQLLHENHPDAVEEIKQTGKGYLSVINAVQILEIIKAATQAVGPENLDSQAIYDAAQSFTLMLDGLQRFSFSETKRTSPDRVAIYETRGDEESIVRVSDWVPAETPP